MANDLRDRNFTPYKPQPKAAQSQNSGCGIMLLGWFLMIVSFGAISAGIGGGAVLTLVAVFLIARGIGSLWKVRMGTSKPVKWVVPDAPQRSAPKPAAKPAPKKKPEEACPNPEPHRHYEAAPRKKEYDTFVAQDKRWPTPEERRLQNMKNLYDAGLLTREEYDDEVRKIKG